MCDNGDNRHSGFTKVSKKVLEICSRMFTRAEEFNKNFDKNGHKTLKRKPDESVEELEICNFDQEKIEYCGPIKVIFQRFLEDSFDIVYRQNYFYSPFFPIIQSSGTGKTRLVHERYEGIDTIYVCLRDKNTPNKDPPRTPYLADLIESFKRVEDWKLFIIILIVYWFEMKEYYDPSNYIHAEILGKKVKELYEKKVSIVHLLSNNCQKMRERRILLALDEIGTILGEECKTITEIFYSFRIGLKEIADKLESFHIFIISAILDTNSSIHNFCPPSYNDRSTRISSFQKILMNAFTFMTNFGVVHFEKHLSNEASHAILSKPLQLPPNANHQANFYPLKMVQFGRPLFTLYGITKCKKYVDLANVERDLIIYAIQKLFNQHVTESFLFTEKDLSNSSIGMTMVLSRIGVPIYSQNSANSHVRSHLATCHFISEHRDMLNVSYKEEPLIAEASAHVSKSDNNFEKGFNAFCEHYFDTFAINIGVFGEIITSIIVLRGIDKAIIDLYGSDDVRFIFCRPLPVGHFLKKILHLKTFEKISICLDDIIMCNNVTYAPDTLTPKIIAGLGETASISLGIKNQNGFDMAIPIIGIYDHNSAILIQIKCYKMFSKREYEKAKKTAINNIIGIIAPQTAAIIIILNIGKSAKTIPDHCIITDSLGIKHQLIHTTLEEGFSSISSEVKSKIRKLQLRVTNYLMCSLGPSGSRVLNALKEKDCGGDEKKYNSLLKDLHKSMDRKITLTSNYMIDKSN